MEFFESQFHGRVTLKQYQDIIAKHNEQVVSQKELVSELKQLIDQQAAELNIYKDRESMIQKLFLEMFGPAINQLVRGVVLETFDEDIFPHLSVNSTMATNYYGDYVESELTYCPPSTSNTNE